MKPTDTHEFFDSLNAGVFSQQLGRALSDVAAGVVGHEKKGKIVITLEFAPLGQNHQVKINHKLDYSVPTLRGSQREDTALDTPLYVTENGLELFLRSPTDQLFSKQQTPVIPRAV